MKITKKLDPIIAGLSAAIIIAVLAFLSFETSTGYWLMISFGATSLIIFVLHDKEFAQPGNIFFGHFLGITVGILFNEFFGMSSVSLALAVGSTITLMMYLKVVHPPAAANPLIAILGDVSFEFIIFPVMAGSLIIIFFSIVINKFILKRNYPIKWL